MQPTTAEGMIMFEWLSTVSGTSWLTMAAIVIGPIAAVQIEKRLEAGREKKRLRLELFKTLMVHRASLTSYENVAALNSINLVFDGKRFHTVRTRWKSLLSHFNERVNPRQPGYEQAMAVWTAKTTELTGELLREMGERLGFEFDDVDIRKGAYFPIAHEDQQAANNLIRDRLVRILAGDGHLNVRIVADTKTSLTPPDPLGPTDHTQAEHGRAE